MPRPLARWDLERQVRLVAGTLVLASVLGAPAAVPRARLLAGGIGAGLTVVRAHRHLRHGPAAGRLPYNRGPAEPAAAEVLDGLPATGSRHDGQDAPVIPLTIALAVLVGVRLGLLGGGGSILAVPLLVYVAGHGDQGRIATSLLVVGATSAVGVIPHARAGRVRWRTGLIFGSRRHDRRLRRRAAVALHPRPRSC